MPVLTNSLFKILSPSSCFTGASAVLQIKRGTVNLLSMCADNGSALLLPTMMPANPLLLMSSGDRQPTVSILLIWLISTVTLPNNSYQSLFYTGANPSKHFQAGTVAFYNTLNNNGLNA